MIRCQDTQINCAQILSNIARKIDLMLLKEENEDKDEDEENFFEEND